MDRDADERSFFRGNRLKFDVLLVGRRLHVAYDVSDEGLVLAADDFDLEDAGIVDERVEDAATRRFFKDADRIFGVQAHLLRSRSLTQEKATRHSRQAPPQQQRKASHGMDQPDTMAWRGYEEVLWGYGYEISIQYVVEEPRRDSTTTGLFLRDDELCVLFVVAKGLARSRRFIRRRSDGRPWR